MPTNYCLRLYRFNPLTNAALAASGPQMNDVYGAGRALVGWAADFTYGAGPSGFTEQLVSMSDPNGQNQISNIGAVAFRCGLPGASDADATYVGLVPASGLGASLNSFNAGAMPVSVVTLGARVRVAGAGRLSIAPGALIFQL